MMYSVWYAGTANVNACPFCSATQQTISEEIASAEISVIAKLIQPAATSDDPTNFDLAGNDFGMARFAVQNVLRGDESSAALEEIEVVYFGKDDKDRSFLINALVNKGPRIEKIAVSSIDWATPLPLTERGVHYVNQLADLPKRGADRLAFFQEHLEDEDPLLAQDAYDEFAMAPYSEVVDLADRMDRQQLIDWISDPRIGPSRRRLYLTMLGTCGTASDGELLEAQLLYDYQLLKPGVSVMLAAMARTGPAMSVSILDELIRADVRRKQQCLDALIAAYLKLKGPTGLPLVEEKFLRNSETEYSHTYAALMALRFHGEETDVLPRERILESLHLVLDNKQFADQVVPDLARWEDWSVMDKLVSLFKAGEKDGWIRQPVVSYLLVAAEQEGPVGDRADAALADLEEIDPECVTRARRNSAFSMFAAAVTKSGEGLAKTLEKPVEAPQGVAGQPSTVTLEKAAPSTLNSPESAKTAAKMTSSEVQRLAKNNEGSPSQIILIGVPLIAGLVLMGIFALLLRGADVRSGSADTDVQNQ